MNGTDIDKIDLDSTFVTIRTKCVNGVFSKVYLSVTDEPSVEAPCNCGDSHEKLVSLADLNGLLEREKARRTT